MNQPQTTDLGSLRKGQKGRITRVGTRQSTEDSRQLMERFMAMGFVEGSEVEVLHEGPFGSDPLAVKVRGSLVALRRHEAQGIEVELIHD